MPEFESPEAREKWILGHDGFCKRVAQLGSRFVGVRGLEFEDLVQSAWAETVRLAPYYREDIGNFPGFAYKNVRSAVRSASSRQVNAIIVNESQFSKGKEYIPNDEIAKAIEFASKAGTCCSLGSEPVASTKEPEEIVAEREHVAMLFNALKQLPARERYVVMSAYGIGCDPVPQTEIAEQLGVGKGRVGQIRDAAFAKLRKKLASVRDEL